MTSYRYLIFVQYLTGGVACQGLWPLVGVALAYSIVSRRLFLRRHSISKAGISASAQKRTISVPVRVINGLDDMLGSTICIHQLFRQTSFVQPLSPGRRKHGYPKADGCGRLVDADIQSYVLRDFHSRLYSYSRSNVAFILSFSI